jgi:hypothetical protein
VVEAAREARAVDVFAALGSAARMCVQEAVVRAVDDVAKRDIRDGAWGCSRAVL